MVEENAVGGFGTRIYFIPTPGMDPKSTQILKGRGYVTLNLKGAHYRSTGNLWQKIFGGSDKVSLSTQVTHRSSSGVNDISSSSIEEVRKIDVGHPFYFGSGRFIALKLPTDCDGIEMAVTMSAIKSDNLSGALEILNSGELKGTLQLAPPAVSASLAVANVVKKLLTATDPQNSLQGSYAGRLATASADDPVRDFCLVQGTIILIYRESDDDTSLDDLDSVKLSTDGDGLKYDGRVMDNTYVMFQVSFDQLRGEDPSSQWSSMFSSAEQALDQLVTVSSDTDKQKIWATAYATYQQAVKLLMADPSYTRDEATGVSALHLISLRKKYATFCGPTALKIEHVLSIENPALESLPEDNLETIASDYLSRLSRANVALPGRRH